MLKTTFRITILALFLFIGIFGIYSFQNYSNQSTSQETPQILSEETKISPEIKIYDKQNGIFTIIFPDQSLSLVSNSSELSVQDFATNNRLDYLINAGFFLEDKSHAGLLIQNGEKKVSLATLDKQLSHVVVLNDNAIKFAPKEDFIYEGIQNAFQVGPLFIDRNNIREDLINNSVNGRGRYLRSILGITESGKSFFMAFTRPRSLNEVYEYILELKDLKNEIVSAVNLDGGSSVAIFSLTDETFTFGSQKRLPFFLGWEAGNE